MQIEKTTAVSDELRKLFVDSVNHMLYCELRLIEAEPLMQRSVTSSELRDFFKKRLNNTEHLDELIENTDMETEPVSTKNISKADVIINNITQLLFSAKDQSLLRDICIITNMQRFVNYLSSSYNYLARLADLLDRKQLSAFFKRLAYREKSDERELVLIMDSLNVNNYRSDPFIL